MNLTGRDVFQKAERVGKNPDHMAQVAALPCVICTEFDMVQTSRTEVHHCIHGRGGNRKVPDTMTIPLCADHHREGLDRTKIALHRAPHDWQCKYGPDTEWLSWVEHRLGLDT